ncbi:STAS domain-containing protein [Nonomuraea sp. NPDC049750]|uniref:STAS domain-containing protein n=1 Tax=Nonomuraea sp. NPDC049750 TaxID=3154738 RepID=UPI0033CF2AFB
MPAQADRLTGRHLAGMHRPELGHNCTERRPLMRFSSTRHSAGDGVVTLIPAGEIDLLTAGALRAAIEDTLHAPGHIDIVDLARVTFLDCAGISVLVAGRNIAIRRGRGYTVINPQRRVRRALDLTGVSEELTYLPQRAPSSSRPARSPRPGRRRLDQWAELAPPAAAELRHVSSGLDSARRWPTATRATIVTRPQQANHPRWPRAPPVADCDRVFCSPERSRRTQARPACTCCAAR